MVYAYSHSHEVDKLVIVSYHYDAFTCTLDYMLNCTLSDSGGVC